MESLLLKADEVAQVLKLGRTRTFQLMSSGELPVVRIGRSVRVPKDQLERWVRSRTTGGLTGWVDTDDSPATFKP
jgi:excisionase family DNA binding protein